MRDLRTVLKRGADVETVQDASAERTGRAENKVSQTRQTLVVWTCTAKFGNHFPANEVVQIGDRDYAGQNRVIQADENPNVWRTGIWILHQCYKPDGKRVRLHIGADSLRCRRCHRRRYPMVSQGSKISEAHRGAQWCHYETEKLLRCNMVSNRYHCDKRRAHPPCNKVNVEVHKVGADNTTGLLVERAIPIEDSTCCAQRSRQYFEAVRRG